MARVREASVTLSKPVKTSTPTLTRVAGHNGPRDTTFVARSEKVTFDVKYSGLRPQNPADELCDGRTASSVIAALAKAARVSNEAAIVLEIGASSVLQSATKDERCGNCDHGLGRHRRGSYFEMSLSAIEFAQMRRAVTCLEFRMTCLTRCQVWTNESLRAPNEVAAGRERRPHRRQSTPWGKPHSGTLAGSPIDSSCS